MKKDPILKGVSIKSAGFVSFINKTTVTIRQPLYAVMKSPVDFESLKEQYCLVMQMPVHSSEIQVNWTVVQKFEDCDGLAGA
jgi:hypothetical protein